MTEETTRTASDERIGVLFSPRDNPELAVQAEELGYESVWAAEEQGKSVFGKLERWATATDEIRLAAGIVSVFSSLVPLLIVRQRRGGVIECVFQCLYQPIRHDG
jgi:alkanesulfonate monooxygenase SsuD/methylene tetrahydromethanopterin reductase-like flavin-dependent oxidoreductase (luciferase family)